MPSSPCWCRIGTHLVAVGGSMDARWRLPGQPQGEALQNWKKTIVASCYIPNQLTQASSRHKTLSFLFVASPRLWGKIHHVFTGQQVFARCCSSRFFWIPSCLKLREVESHGGAPHYGYPYSPDGQLVGASNSVLNTAQVSWRCFKLVSLPRNKGLSVHCGKWR